jgi:hypothetical protein
MAQSARAWEKLPDSDRNLYQTLKAGGSVRHRAAVRPRTIRDVHAAHVGPALLRQAIADGRRTNRLRAEEADRLTLRCATKSSAK